MTNVTHFSTSALSQELESRGYLVTSRDKFPWERPCEFSKRHGYGPTWLSTRLKRRFPPVPPFEADQGRTGRIVALRSNPALEEFAERFKRPAESENERLREVLAGVHAATDLATARRRAYEGRLPNPASPSTPVAASAL